MVCYASGAKSLNCKASIPVFFNTLADDLTPTLGTNSEQVSFKEAEDREDAPIILYSSIVIVILIATVLFTRASAKKMTAMEQKNYQTEHVSEAIETVEATRLTASKIIIAPMLNTAISQIA